MITTHERIEDPLAFLQAHPDITKDDSRAAIIVSAPDIDAAIWRQGANAPVVTGRVDKQVSPILGDLYRAGNAYGVEVDGDRYNISWFPSPTAANALSEGLGKVPGDTALQFVHTQGSQIKTKTYAEHLGRAEFPQSTGNVGYFTHDRDDDHAIPVLLLPTQAVKRIQTYGKAGDYPFYGRYERGGKPGRIASAFDSMTAKYGRLAVRLWPQVLAGQLEPINDPKLEDREFRNANYYGHLELLGVDRYVKRKEYAKVLSEFIFDALSEFRPAILALQEDQRMPITDLAK